MQLSYLSLVQVLPVYILLRFECVQHATGEGSRGEVEEDSVHPRVFIQLQYLFYNLHTHTHKRKDMQHVTVNIAYAGTNTVRI